MTTALADSYRFCETLARREAANFYHAFRLLPRPQRKAMCALYAFLRVTDDLADQPGSREAKAAALAAWRKHLDRLLEGETEHELDAAFCDTVRSYRIPSEYLHAVIDGVEMDLDISHYATFEELRKYCYHVASVVGLSCIHIWGFHGEKAIELAEQAGIALQLTNILRDLREDAARGRVYLPREDLDRFGYSEADLKRGERGERFEALMRFEIERARRFYDSSSALERHLECAGRAVFQVMTRTYRELLDAIEACGYDVFSRRVTVPRWRKVALLAAAIPVRFGLG
jgi:phytoene synthase